MSVNKPAAGRPASAPDSSVFIERFPSGLTDDLQGRSLKNRFILALEQYPLAIKPLRPTEEGHKRFRIKCVGITMSEESFDLFIKRWLTALWDVKHKHCLTKSPSIENSSVDITVDGVDYRGVYPVNGIPDAEGYYSFFYVE